MANLLPEVEMFEQIEYKKKALVIKDYEQKSNNIVIAKHLGNTVANTYFGKDKNSNVALVIPANYGRHKIKAVLIINNTTAIIGGVNFFGCVSDIANSAKNTLGTSGQVPIGESRVFTSRDVGLEKIDTPFPGLITFVTFGAGGTGTFDIYLLGGVN